VTGAPFSPSLSRSSRSAGCRHRAILTVLISALVLPGVFLPGAPLLAADGQLQWVPAGSQPAAPADSLLPAVQEDLASRTQSLAHEGRWAEVVSICETAARKGTLAPGLRHQYDLAKLHCDVARRHAEPAFRRQLDLLSEADARRVHAEVLGRIATHHVDTPDFDRLSRRGRLALEVALQEPTFVAAHARQVTPERMAIFREQIGRLVADRPVTSQAEAETMAAWVTRVTHSVLGIAPAVTLMEMTAAAVGGLDEYSAFLTNGQLDDLYAQIEGRFVGLGVELRSAADGLLVVNVIAGSPAERSGLRAGDHLVGVGGRSLGGMGVDEAAHLLQGPEGSLVTLAVLRAPAPARAVTVRREHVEVPSVEQARIIDQPAGVAYAKISSFQKTTAKDLELTLRRLEAQDMRSLVIDLRGNPGGLLSAAVDVADLFLERGLVVATRGRSPDEDFNYSAGRPGTWRMPLVVLIDGDSASSSEIFAGAIRDHRRGPIVGTRSYGKGSIQGIFPLETAGVGLRLTTAQFFSPRGLPYSRVGVEPDLPVQTVARPVEGAPAAVAGSGDQAGLVRTAATPDSTTHEPAAIDTVLDVATETARRLSARPVAKPVSRSTAAR
jgi:carboxyl-terminal processing protease